MARTTTPKIQLFVAEKPSVARDLARILGAHHREPGALCGETIWVTWCIGHVAELEEPHAYDPSWRTWRKEALPMLPEAFRVRPTQATLAHWQHLRGWMMHKRVGEIINACDAGREGELIFGYAMELAGCKKPVRRLWLNALTDAAVHTALRGMRPQAAYAPLADAARCRAEADWLVGLNATRALTLVRRDYETTASMMTVGRVQTPTLAMLVAREEAIEAFEPEPYWQVACTLEAPGTPAAPNAEPTVFKAMYTHTRAQEGKQEATDRIATEADARAIERQVSQGQGRITAVDHKTYEDPQPLLHDLTSLQRVANIRHQLTAQQTLEAAQGLYERHKAITYPRTDSNYLPSTLVPTLSPLLARLARGPFAHLAAPLCAEPPAWPKVPLRRIVQDSEVSDHHAIIPTGKPLPPLGPTQAEQQVYALIVRRTLAAFYPPAKISVGRIEANVAGLTLVGRGRMVTDPGWHAADPPVATPAQGTLLPALSRDDGVRVQAARVLTQSTKPPPRLSEASLLGAMERAGAAISEPEMRLALKDAGLGTPATRANMIETLKRRHYVEAEGRQLRPSAQGRALLAALPVEALKSAQLTGLWESKLSQVAKGTLSREAFMGQTRQFVREMVRDILATVPQTKARPRVAAPRPKGAPLKPGLCPVCGEPQVAGPERITCARGRACSFVIFRVLCGRTLTEPEITTLLRGDTTDHLKGFVSRAGKPFAARLALDAQGRVAFMFSK